jgi:hypothetical protein
MTCLVILFSRVAMSLIHIVICLVLTLATTLRRLKSGTSTLLDVAEDFTMSVVVTAALVYLWEQ